MATKNKVTYFKTEAEMWGHIKGKFVEQAAKGHFVNKERLTSKAK